MNEHQTKIINAIKENDFGETYSNDRVVTLLYLYRILPDLSQEEIGKAIAEFKDIKIIDSGLQRTISIPKKYFL